MQLDKIPSVGSIWRHNKGSIYRVLMIANQHGIDLAKWPIMVIYRSIALNQIWARPLDSWDCSFVEVNLELEIKEWIAEFSRLSPVDTDGIDLTRSATIAVEDGISPRQVIDRIKKLTIEDINALSNKYKL